MPLFVCDECGVVDNTATCGFAGWHGRNADGRDGKARCSECRSVHSHWHGLFPRKQWDGQRKVLNRASPPEGQ